MIMKNDTYTPAPVDTSDIQLPEELCRLADLIARNVHEVWSASRIAEGWRYGPERDDKALKTPCLVPYDDLTDSEKAYDLNTAFETLRLIRKLGFDIIPPKK